MSTATIKKRKKVNFMIDIDILEQLEKFIPAGKRSDFINEKMQEIVREFTKRTALDYLDQFKKKKKIKESTQEIIKAIRYGRK